jgi:NarL family two-component system response regulator LiaR
MSPIKIILADDHTMFREGLRAIINGESDMAVVGEARDGFEVLEKVNELTPDVVLMDINMPRLDGIKATRHLSAQHPQARVIILTMYGQDQYVFESIRAGAWSYILKDAPARRLIETIRAVYRGEAVIDPSVTLKVLEQFRQLAQGQQGKDFPLLNEREVEILRLVAQGATNSAIAERLFLSENTVKHMVSEIIQKLHVNNRAEAIAYVMREGLIMPGL